MQDSSDFFKAQILYQTVSDSSSDHKKSRIQFNAEPTEQILSNSPPSLASLCLIGDYDLCLKAAGRFIGLSPEQEKECKEFEYDEGILAIRKNEKLILIYKGLPDAFFNIENLTKEDSLAVMYIRYLIDLCPKILIITPKNFGINEESLNPWEKSLNPEITFQCNQIAPVVNIKVKSLSEVNSGIEGPEQEMCADGTNFLTGQKKIAVNYLNIVKSEIDVNSESKSQHFISFKRSSTQKPLIYEVQKEKLFKEWTSSLDTIENLQIKIEEECGKFIDIDYYLEFKGFLAEHINKYSESISNLEEKYQEKIKDSKNQLEAQRILREKQNQALESCLRRFFKWMDVRKNYKSTTFTFPIVSCDIIKANGKPTSFTFKSHRQLEFSLGSNETSEISNISLHFTANSDEGCSGFFMAADKEDNKTSLLCFEFRERENMPLIITKEAEFASADTKMIIDNSLGLILVYDDSTRKASISLIQQKRKFEKFLDANLYKEVPLGSSKPLEKILGGCFLRDNNSILLFDQNYTLLEYEYMSKTLKTVQHQINENGHLKESAVRPKNVTDRYTEAQSFATGKFVILKCKTTLDIYDMNWKLINSVIISRQFRAFKLFSQGTDTYLIIQEANALLVYLLSESLDSLSYKALADEPFEVPKGNPLLDVFYLAYKQFGPHFHFMGAPSRTEIILLSESSNFSSQVALDYFEDLGCSRMDLKVNKGIAISSFGFEHLNLFSEENLVRSTSLSFILTTRIPAQCVRIEDSCIVPLINHKDVSKKISQLIRSRSKDLNTLANIINTIKLGVYDKLISSTETAFKVVSIVGNKDASQSHILNRLFGSRFDVNTEKDNDDIWITMCRIKEQNFLVIDFRSILSFEMKEQEKFKLSLTLTAISDVLILNQDLTFGNKVKAFYKYFRHMTGRINRADLFKGSLHIFINGVENSEQKNACQEIVDNFTIRMHKLKNDFLSKLFPGQIRLQALHPFTEASVDKELDKMRSNLLNIPYRWFNGREVLETFKTLLGQASLDDYIDIKITKPRLAYLRWVEEYCLEDDLGNVDDIDTKLVYKSHEQNNQGKVSYKYPLMLESPQDFTLYSIAMKLNEIERMYIENRTNAQLEEIFNNWAKIFNKIYTENTQLRKYDEQGNCLLDFMSKLDDEEYQNQKKFYISDIRNFFLQKVMNTAYGLSNFLERFITQFVSPTSKVTEYIMVLLRGEALWKFAIQFYRALYSLTGDSVLVEKLLFPNFTHHFENKFGDFLQNQINYVKAFFESCEFNLAPIRQNVTSIGNYKTYYTMLSNLHLWFINIHNDYAKFGICIPPILELTKDFLDILELICPRNAPEAFNEIIKNVIFGSAGYATMCPLIDDFLEGKKGELKKDDQYKVANFQAGSLFRHWILYHNKDQLDDLIKRLVERINNDKDFPNFCTPIFKLIMPQKNFSTITEIFAALEKPENLLSSLVTHIKDNKELDCPNNLSIILTDYFSQILVDPKIESETKSSTKLVEDYQNFLLYVEILENQKCNDIQLLAILAFFRHYLSCYVECFLESYNSQAMRDVDFILNKGSRLTNSLCIYCMKKLRLKQSSFKDLEKLLYEIKKADWPQRFQAQFSSAGKSRYYIPLLSKNKIERRIEEKWIKLKETAFNKKELFKELITESGTNHYTQYQVLSLFLQDVYTGAIGPVNLESLKALMRSEHVLIINSFSKYQCTLLNCYVDQCVNQHFLHIGPDPASHDIHLQMAILNAANWLVSLNRFNSPWTSLFFKNGVVPNPFIAHYNNQFVIGNQDAVLENLPYEYDFYKTNGSFSFLPDNMNSSQKKDSLSTEDTEIYRRLTTRHSSYAFSNDETIATNNSITKITTDFLQFLFYASLYVFTSLNWISPEHALQVVDAGTIDTILAYLKDKIICNIIGLNNRLEYKEDPISWVIGLQQMLPQIIEEKNMVGNYHNISYRNRQNFVVQVQRLISDNKNKTTSYLYTLDSILCEQIMTSDYHFINLLRNTRVLCFEDMALYDNLIKSRYILLEKCRERIQDLEEIAKLSSIIDFSNEVMKFADYQITQEDAESLKIADFIATMSNEKQYSMKLKLAEFLKAWNTLNFKNSCLSKSRALRPIEQYNESSPVIAFITSSQNRSGQLARMISLLSEKQNQFLEEIVGTIRNLKEIKEYNFLNNDLYLPQSVNPEGILNITKDIKLNHIFSLACSCDYKYGNGDVVIFDFETIQSKLLAEIMKKKKLIIDSDLYPSIHFLGEFAKQDKFEEEILKLRRLNPGNLIMDSLKLKEEFNELQRGKPKLFEVKLKQLQGSLEKIMMLYNMSPHNNITLTHFAQNHCFDAMSPVLTEEMSIKYYDISYLISLYELIEEVKIKSIWDKILHRNFRMTATVIREIETKAITDWLKNIKSNSHSIKLMDINTAILRFVSRCLAFSDLPYDNALKNYLFKRKDYWARDIPEKQIQSIEEKFPRVTLAQIGDFQRLIESVQQSRNTQSSRPPNTPRNVQVFM